MVAALMMNHAVSAKRQAFERDGRAFHVLEDRLELVSAARLDDTVSVNPEPRMRPRSHERRSFFIDRSTLLEGVEKRVTERELQLGEIEVGVDAIDTDTIGRVKRSLTIEDTARDQCMNMGMRIQ